MFTDMWTQSNMSPIYNYPTNFRLDEEMKKMEKVLKTSFVCVFRRRLGQDQYIRLGHTSSRLLQDVFKMSSRRLQDALPRRLQDVLQKLLQDIFKTSCQDIFSKRLQDVLQKHLQEIVSKTYH